MHRQQVISKEERETTNDDYKKNKRGTLEEKYIERVYNRIVMNVNKFALKSKIANSKELKELPQFKRREIRVGRLLGAGGFSQAYSIDSISIRPKKTRSRKNGDNNDSNDDENTKRKQSIAEKRQYRGESPFVVKHIQSKFLENPKKFKDAAVDLVLEAHFLTSLKHKHILNIHGWSSVSNFKSGRHNDFFLILERLVDTLDKRILRWKHLVRRYKDCPTLPTGISSKKEFLFAGRIQVARDIASALEYIHSKDLIYRDLKPSNIGFDLEGNVKLFDFGLCREMPSEDEESNPLLCASCVRNDNDVYDMSGRCGTARYMAPEVCLSMPYNQKIDVYSFGVLLFEIMGLNKPFASHSRASHYYKVAQGGQRPAIGHTWPVGIQALIHCAWSEHLSVRPTMKEVVQMLDAELFALRDRQNDGLANVTAKNNNNNNEDDDDVGEQRQEQEQRSGRKLAPIREDDDSTSSLERTWSATLSISEEN